MAITRRQKEVLDFIDDFWKERGYSPSFEEIANGLDLRSLATVHKHISNLQEKGFIKRSPNRSRSIDVSAPGRRGEQPSNTLLLKGQIAAGQPVDAAEGDDSISLADIIGDKDVFALKVRGDSMRDENLIDGDFVIVEQTPTARSGDMIVALVDRLETTLKRYYPEGDVVRLQPSNGEMRPIYVPAVRLEIQGKVLGMIRRYS